MKTTEIPFNKYIGIEQSDKPEHSLLVLNESAKLVNHLGTVHAGTQFALAEACSGEYLLRKFARYSDRVIPVVRKTETKYKKPAQGPLFALASIDSGVESSVIEKLEQKGRAIVPVHITIVDESNEVTMTALIEWFVQIIDKGE